ncbi:hypothetical protein B0H34DRAFT_863068 [Crassisporium funariophilum]|nr:hypothetical protein B0H34DRAFT_863068 [Crassisporium funariophilum]
MFFLDMLDNLPRLRLSDDHMKAIIWTMKKCGTPDVPLFKALRKKQKTLAEQVNIQPKLHTSAMGNLFWMNHPTDLITLDWANPFVRDFIHMYPEITSTVSESWQAAKFVEEVDMQDLSPMWANWECAPHWHFYVGEISQLNDGHWVIPVRWIVVNKVVHAEAYQVVWNKRVQRATEFAGAWRAHSAHIMVPLGPVGVIPPSTTAP